MTVVDLTVGTVALVVGFAFGVLWMRPQIALARGESRSANTAAAEARANSQRLEADLERQQSELENSRQARVESERNLAVANARYETEATGLKQELRNTFSELAQSALNSSAATLVELAKQKLNVEVESAKSVVLPIVNDLTTLRTTLADFKLQTATTATSMTSELGRLSQLSTGLQTALLSSTAATSELRSALANTSVRAKWGELALRKIAELSGMTEHCDFELQETFMTDDGLSRPDMIVKLVGGQQIPVDSKAPYTAYIASTQTLDPSEQQRLLKESAVALRDRVKELSQRRYDQIPGYAGFTILFVPYESYVAAAATMDQTLIEDAAVRKVYIASPTLLLCYLQAFAHGWRVHQQAENAERIAEAGRKLYESVAIFATKFRKLGLSIDRGVKHFNEAVGSYVGRIAPRARAVAALAALPQAAILPTEIERTAEIDRISAIAAAEEQEAESESEVAEEDESVPNDAAIMPRSAF